MISLALSLKQYEYIKLKFDLLVRGSILPKWSSPNSEAISADAPLLSMFPENIAEGLSLWETAFNRG